MPSADEEPRLARAPRRDRPCATEGRGSRARRPRRATRTVRPTRQRGLAAPSAARVGRPGGCERRTSDWRIRVGHPAHRRHRDAPGAARSRTRPPVCQRSAGLTASALANTASTSSLTVAPSVRGVGRRSGFADGDGELHEVVALERLAPGEHLDEDERRARTRRSTGPSTPCVRENCSGAPYAGVKLVTWPLVLVNVPGHLLGVRHDLGDAEVEQLHRARRRAGRRGRRCCPA